MAAARAAVVVLLAAAAAATAAADTLRAHDATYHLAFKGIGAGELELRLEAGTEPGSFVYETLAHPSLLARLVVNSGSRERCWFHVTSAGVEPDHYLLDDGTAEHKDSSDLTYDRSRGRITGIARGAPLDLPLEAGLEDVLSIRIAPVVDLLAGREPREYALLDGREVKHYLYARVGSERLKTALGEFDTVVYTSDRKGSDGKGRIWQYWFAPALGWLPVRAEQREDGHARLTLAISRFSWLPAAGGAR